MKDSIYYTNRYGFMPWTVTIAQVLETDHLDWDRKEIAKHLRNAQDEIDRLNDELAKRPAVNKDDGLVCAKCHESFKQNPLTKEEIDDLVHEHNLLDDYPYDFVRAIEERHGIK